MYKSKNSKSLTNQHKLVVFLEVKFYIYSYSYFQLTQTENKSTPAFIRASLW